MSQRIDPGNPPYAFLRKLLRAAFDSKSLSRLGETPPFGELRYRFSPSDNLDDMIDEVLEFSRTQSFWEELLDATAARSPKTYNGFAEGMGWPPVPVPEVVVKSSEEKPDVQPETLTKPTFDEAEVYISALGDGHYRTRIKTSKGEGVEEFESPWTSEQLTTLLSDLEHRETDRDSLVELGSQLFQAMFAGKVLNRYMQATSRASGGLRLRLWLEPPELQALPWELMYDDERRKFLTLAQGVLVTRYLPVAEEPQALVVEPPLRVLVATASPKDGRPLGVEAEAEAVERALASQVKEGKAKVKVLHHARADDLGEAIEGFTPHVLHFVGHGALGPEGGALVLEDPQGLATPLPASTLAYLITWAETRLAVLNACLSSRDLAIDASPLSDRRRAMLGVGPALVNAGLGAVVGNQFSQSDEAGRLFAQKLYDRLALFDPVDEAVSRARLALVLKSGEGARDWATPVLFLRAPDGVIFARG
jgi:hypothetical protein